MKNAIVARIGEGLATLLPDVVCTAFARQLAERNPQLLLEALGPKLNRTPSLDTMPFDLAPTAPLQFEDLAGLFASTSLDHGVIAMTVRQTAYLFGLVRRMKPRKVIEIGRYKGGSTITIAAAMAGQGEFWSIDIGEKEARLHQRAAARTFDDEIRDIAVTRLDNGVWTAPKPVHADGWKIDACPVAGPALAASGDTAVVAWYSEAGGTPTLRLARSPNSGERFFAPVTLDAGAAVLGRAAVAIDAQQVWVAWLREDTQGQALMLARYTPDLSKPLQKIEVAKLGARGLASGYPKLVVDAGGAWLVWTDVVKGVAHLKGARIAR